MNSLKKQLPILVIGPLVILAVIMTIILSVHMKDRALLATSTKAESDLKMGETIIDLWYPGDWEYKNGILYKGDKKISHDSLVVDKIARLTGDTVTIFLGDVRVATTVREKTGERAIGTSASEEVVNTVLKHGQMYLGEANVVGDLHQTAYKPIRDVNGKIIGMFYVGISQAFANEMIHTSIIQMSLISIALTIIVSIAAWFFVNRMIVEPIEQITQGTKAITCGQPCDRMHIDTSNEIGELANSFNTMLDSMQKIALQINNSSNSSKPIPGIGDNLTANGQLSSPLNVATAEQLGEGADSGPNELQHKDINGEKVTGEHSSQQLFLAENLPKGLNDTTFKQILSYLRNQNNALSAEEVGDGVNLTRVTARRYLEFLEQNGIVAVELKYGTVGRPVKLYLYKEG